MKSKEVPAGQIDASRRSMTLPRRVMPGSTALITRRTVGRTHLFRPDHRMKQLFIYYLAVLAEKHGVLVHAAVLMSTHEHLVVTDTRGTLPNFLRDFHRMLALGVRRIRRWPSVVWDHRKSSVVELFTHDAVVEKIAYTIANPSTAGLVRRSHEWPGVITLPEQIGTGSWEVKRPMLHSASKDSRWPPMATLKIAVPPALAEHRTDLVARVRAELSALEEAARNEAQRKRWHFPSRSRLRTQSPFKRATDDERRGELNPVFAVGRKHRTELKLVIKLVREYHADYRKALGLWRSGVRDVVFPAGTWLMRQLHRALVQPLSASVPAPSPPSMAAE